MARGLRFRCYCYSCFRAFDGTPEVPFDAVAAAWTSALAALQEAGELIAVRLGEGFYGICLIAVESPLHGHVR